MAIYSGIFNSVNGDRKYNAWWFAKYFSTFIGNGVFPNPSTNLQVVENENMTVTVKPGSGWIDGYFIFSDSDHVMQLDIADGVLKRIDRIVMRLNHLTRQIEIVVKKGTFASNPVVSPLQRDAEYHELALADVLITNGATRITQANITDTRLNNDLCGIVHGLVNQVDTTTIFNQYQKWLEEQSIVIDEWQTQQKAEFENWFNGLRVILDGDVATNLANQIYNLNKKIDSRVNDVSETIKIKRNITILATGWVEVSEGLYKYDINDVDIDENSIVDVNLHFSSLKNADVLMSANESSLGKVSLFAEDIPLTNLVADIKIIKELVVT